MQRRQFLSCAGTAITAPTLLTAPAARAAAEIDGSTTYLEQKLAEFALSFRYKTLPPEVVTAVKRIVIDTFACAFGAVGSEAATIGESTIRSTFGDSYPTRLT